MSVAVAAGPFFLTGCAAVYYPDPTVALVEQGRGTYHTVEKGETLWAIAQAYQIDIDQIILLNNIQDGDLVRKGQKIFIPGARHSTRVDPVRVQPVRASSSQEPVAYQRGGVSDNFTWPVRGSVVSTFHGRDAGFWDQGIRVQVPSGTTISATRSGKAVFVDELTGYGQTVILDHMDGFMSVYAGHVQPVIRMGDSVRQGEAVVVPSAGERGFLYFEIRRHGAAVNPLFYLPRY